MRAADAVRDASEDSIEAALSTLPRDPAAARHAAAANAAVIGEKELRAPRDGKGTIEIPATTLEEALDEKPFRPTKVTIPLNPPAAMRSELDALRQEFKERLKQSRQERAAKQGNGKDGD